MKRINLLSVDTANKIAAGEVIERPFSVVKECVENSLDANSSKILIEIENGGSNLIKIIDDGKGIHPEDIEKAFLSHATSKISSIEDIFSINTMGFRGEALSSIASISKTSLKSRTENLDFGREIYIEGGEIKYKKDAPSNKGTTIEVKDLFFNVPARAKFLKTPQREASLINDIVTRLALANYERSFTLFNNGKKVLSTFGSSNLKDTIRTIYGKEIYDNIISFEGHNDTLSIFGFIGNADISRGSRNNQSIFVNKRYVKNKTINAAIENAFKSFLTINKFPFFIIFIDVYPELIDVNVHPTKAEIKFKDERDLYSLTFNTVHSSLRDYLKEHSKSESHLPEFLKEDLKENNTENLKEDLKTLEQTSMTISLKPNTIFNTVSFESETSNEPKNETIEVSKSLNLTSHHTLNESLIKEKPSLFNGDDMVEIAHDNFMDKTDKTYIKNNYSINNEENSIITNPYLSETKEAKFGDMNIIGQFNNTYILCESNNSLYIIDQHAAHEKILFERYVKSINNRTVHSQMLLTPEIMELTSEDFMLFNENIEIFDRTGFNIEIFGNNTISIREVPFILEKPELKSLFFDILDNLKSLGSGETSSVKFHKIATMACKSAVKASLKLSLEEMKALIEELRYIEDPFNCPHGRPTIIKITLEELEKKFKRRN